MAGRGSGRRGFGDRVGSAIQEVPPWESGVVPVGLTLEEVQGVAPKKMAGLAPSTVETYDYLSEYFVEWCSRRGIELEEVETLHLRVYLEEARYRPQLRVYPKATKRKPRPVSVTWLRSTIAAVKKVLKFQRLDHRIQWQALSEWIRDEARVEKRAPVSADGLTWELVQLVEAAACKRKDGEWPEKTRRRAAFDAALIRLMWSCLLRRSEAAAVTWGHITPAVLRGHAYGVLDIPSSKTDRFGKGEVGYLHVENLALLQELAVACGRDPMKRDQLVFDICPRQIGVRVKQACEHAGEQTGNATLLGGHWSGHSPRVGAARDLLTHGAGLGGNHASRSVGTGRDPRQVRAGHRGRGRRHGASADGPGSWAGNDSRASAPGNVNELEWRLEMSEKEKVDAGRWEIPEKPFRYVRAIEIGKGAVARLSILRKEEAGRRSCGCARRNVIGLESGMSVEEQIVEGKRLIDGSGASPEVQRLYSRGWRRWGPFCAESGVDPLDASWKDVVDCLDSEDMTKRWNSELRSVLRLVYRARGMASPGMTAAWQCGLEYRCI